MIHYTKNETTVRLGQSIATVIADSISKEGKRITTLESVYPRYIHSELMTHRMFSRNASSSRATPLSVTIDEVKFDPVFFDYVGKNQSGMVAGDELSIYEMQRFHDEWERLGFMVATRVEAMSKNLGIHKQTLNRALEPWLRIRTLVTATEWDNFFKLRLAPDAQPEIQTLASAMLNAMNDSEPIERFIHLPYVLEEEVRAQGRGDWWKVSAARCARVSYARMDGKPTDVESDLKLAKQLLSSGHLSPFEHAAMQVEGQHANFIGWQSYRNYLEL